jgi:2',3'-cyclic-nucleotide 2'-phosphodiesterase (5'-nucleotidase family)
MKISVLAALIGTSLTSNSQITLQILHASDFEGGLTAPQDAPNFAAIVDALEETYTNTLVLASGDNWIPSPFSLSGEDPAMVTPLKNTYIDYFGVNFANNDLRAGIARPDISIMNFIGVEASVLGNHEFDLGTSELRNMIAGVNSGSAIRWFGAQFPYLSSNLNFSGDVNLSNIFEPSVQPDSFFKSNPTMTAAQIAAVRKLAKATIIEENGELFGVVGVTTPILAAISSPGATTVMNPGAGTDDMMLLASIIQPVIDDLILNQGVSKVILLAHLQQLTLEKELATYLHGVDIILAGGSHTLMADPQDRMRAGDVAAETYPFFTTDADGNPTVIVNTTSEYKYVGRLVIDFDSNGLIIPSSVDENISGAFAADDQGVLDLYGDLISPFAAGTKGNRVKTLCDALNSVILSKDGNIFGKTDVYLQGLRNFVRTQETNLGNITADANLWQAKQYDGEVMVSLKNGGGIRSAMGQVFAVGDQVQYLPPAANPTAGKEEGDISQLDIENSLRFNNRLSVLDVTASGLKQLLEHGVAASGPGQTPGRFPQISGMRFSYDLSQPANSRILNAAIVDENGAVLDSIVYNGSVYGDPTRVIKMVTLNFLAGGGDGYPFLSLGSNRVDLDVVLTAPGVATFTVPGSEQDAFAEYINTFYDATPYQLSEQTTSLDLRIQNLAQRADQVYPQAGEFAYNAPAAPLAAYPACSSASADLSLFGPSEFAQTFAVTGEDKWYTLVAPSNGISIDVTAGSNDIIIELQDANGNLVASQNSISGAGDELLISDLLTAGDTYKIGIRNYDSSEGIGVFSVCISFTSSSTCDYGVGPYSLCAMYKADYVAANAYRFDFTSTSTGDTYSATKIGSTFIILSSVPGLAWGDTYDVEITAIYELLDSEGNPITIEVPTQSPCQIIISNQPNAALRLTDQCSNGPKFLGSTVASNPFICSVTDYKWTFTRTDLSELPIVHYRGSSNRFLHLLTVPGLTPGATYDVRVTPIFASGEGQEGPVTCLSIVGPQMMLTSEVLAETENSTTHRNSTSEMNSDMSIYPNPCDGNMIYLNLTGFDESMVNISIFDMNGKLVHSRTEPSTSLLQTIIHFDQALVSGVYQVVVSNNARTFTEKLLVK